MRAQNALIKQGQAALIAVTTALADAKDTPPLARRHLVWTLDGIAGGTPEATMPILNALKDPEADVRAQAARALGQRQVPIAVEPLAELLEDDDPTVRLQAIIALGRIADEQAVPALLPHLAEEDFFIAFSTRQALRRINNWPIVAKGLNSDNAKVRQGILAAMEQVYEPGAVAALIEYALNPEHPETERARAVEYLAVVHRKARPWDGKWWGTRPTHGSPPAKVIEWEGTPLVLETIRRELGDDTVAVRLAAIDAVEQIGDREALPALRARFAAESDETVRREIALALGALKDKEALPALTATLRDAKAAEGIREAALSAVEQIGTEVAAQALTELLKQQDLPVDRQPRVLAALGKLNADEAVPVILDRLSSPAAPVRAASAEALGQIGRTEDVAPKIRPLLEDPEVSVRKSAITALVNLKDRESLPELLKAADQVETALRGDDRAGRHAGCLRRAGVPPRPDRQEPGSPQGVRHGDRGHPRRGRAVARSSRRPQRALPRHPARAAEDLHRPGSIDPVAHPRPVPPQGGAAVRPHRLDRPVGDRSRDWRQAGDVGPGAAGR